MSAHTKKRPINKVEITVKGKKTNTYSVPKSKLAQVLSILKGFELSDTVAWEDLASDRIKRLSKPGIALRGARTKEGMTQVELAKKLKVAQYNISKMENGTRPIGKDMARRIAKALKVDYRLFL